MHPLSFGALLAALGVQFVEQLNDAPSLLERPYRPLRVQSKVRSKRGPQRRFGAPTPCSPNAHKQYLTYPQFDRLVRLAGRRWAEQAQRLGHDYASLLKLAQSYSHV